VLFFYLQLANNVLKFVHLNCDGLM